MQWMRQCAWVCGGGGVRPSLGTAELKIRFRSSGGCVVYGRMLEMINEVDGGSVPSGWMSGGNRVFSREVAGSRGGMAAKLLTVSNIVFFEELCIF